MTACSQCHEEIGECECPRCARCRAFVPRDGETPCSRCGYDGSQSLTPTPQGVLHCAHAGPTTYKKKS